MIRWGLLGVLLCFGPLGAEKTAPLRVSKKALMGLDIGPHASGFRLVDARWCTKESCFLRTDAADAFEAMARAAQADGIALRIVSATRTHADQKRIWEAKWRNRSGSPVDKALDILNYSSMPGTSRHHWGTDFDLNSVDPVYFASGKGLTEYQWLQTHAAEFGFFQPYTVESSQAAGGYREERWHWSYAPLSIPMLRAYTHWVDYADLPYFQGVEVAESLQVFDRFVRAVSVEGRL